MSESFGSRADVAERWRDRLARWRRLGCSISEFCRREGISQPSFFQWRRRLDGDDGSAGGRRRRGRRPAFVPVELVSSTLPAGRSGLAFSTGSDPLANGWMEITLGSIQLRVPVTVDERSLRQLVRIVREEAGEC